MGPTPNAAVGSGEVDEFNFGGYNPSFNNQGSISPLTQGRSRRELGRGATQELAKSEYPAPPTPVLERPPSRRTPAATPTAIKRAEQSMPPVLPSDSNSPIQRGYKTDQNFFQRPDDIFFEPPSKPQNSQQRGGLAQNSRNLMGDTSLGGARKSMQGSRLNASDEDDLFGDSKPQRGRAMPGAGFFEEDRDRSGAFGTSKIINNADAHQGQLQNPQFTPVQGTQVDYLAKLLDATQQEKQESQKEATKIRGELELTRAELQKTKQRLEDTEKRLEDSKSNHAILDAEKERNYKEMKATLQNQAAEERRHLESKYREDLEGIRAQYKEQLEQVRKLVPKDMGADLTNLNQNMKKALQDIKSAQDSDIREKAGLKEQLSEFSEQMRLLNENKARLEEDKRQNYQRIQEENKLLLERQRKIDRDLEEIARREAAVRSKENNLEADILARKRDVEQREVGVESKETLTSQQKLLLDHEKQEFEAVLKNGQDRLARERRELDMRILSVQEKEFAAEKKMKQAIEKDIETRSKHEQLDNQLKILKLREQTLERERLKAEESLRQAAQEKLDIKMFRDTFDFEMAKIEEEKRRLNVFAGKLNEELERLQKDRTNTELMKKTLSNLRSDYTHELMAKLDRDNFVRQDISIYKPDTRRDPLRNEVPLDLAAPIAPKGLLPAGNDHIDLNKVYDRIGTKFDLGDYLTKLKTNY